MRLNLIGRFFIPYYVFKNRGILLSGSFFVSRRKAAGNNMAAAKLYYYKFYLIWEDI